MSVIGIDLGFQSCTIGVPRGGGIEVLLNEYSARQTSSCVSLCEKNRELGDAAQQKTITNHKNTLANFKHLIGRAYKDDFVQVELKKMNAQTEELADGTVGFKVKYLNETKVFSVTQVVGMLLTKLRINAESELKTKVTDCCVGVPAYFNDTQRHALVAAAKLAGLDVKLFNECTSVALAYGIYKKDLPEQSSDAKDSVKPNKVVFIDVGHSQTQACVVDFYKGKLEMKSMASDLVGGQDFDEVIFEHFADEFKEKKKLDVRGNPRACIRLRNECQKVKKLMSANSTPCPLNIECLMDDTDVSGKIARADFEALSDSIFVRIEAVCTKLLQQMKDNGTLKELSDIDSVQIVGGATRIPKIKDIITRVFGQDTKTELNTDEAVARGCALRAAIFSPTLRVRDFSISDKTMHSIKLSWKAVQGLEDEGGDNDAEVFKADSPMGIVKVLTFFRSEPFELVAEYNDPASANQSLIGTFKIDGVTANYENKSNKVKAKIRIDENGCFSVEDANMVEKLKPEEEKPAAEETDAKEGDKDDKKDKEASPAKKKAKTTKTTAVPVITNKPTVLSSDQANKLMEIELAMQAQDRSEREKSDAKNALEEYIYSMRDYISDRYADFILEADADAFRSKLTSYEDWLYDEGEDVSKSEYKAKMDDLDAVGKVVKNRYTEYELRPKALDAYQTALVLCRKFVEAKTAGDEKYAHITDVEFKKVTDAFATSEAWFNETSSKQAALKKSDDPAVTANDLQTKCVAFNAIIQPIMSKPVPKVEPPKEEEKKEEEKPAETKEGETPPTEETTTPPTDDKPTETPAEEPKASADDMDID
eukprot:m.141763 g.141763  ORF g.141763 m.141763 type:complete len:821 (-) comp30212_c0_seq1:421-2883(-)